MTTKIQKIALFSLCILIHAFSLANRTNDKLHFEENKGQWDEKVLFKLGLKSINMYYQNNSITFQMYDFHELLSNDHPKSRERIIAERSKAYYHTYKVDFINSNNTVAAKGLRAIDTYHNYYGGNDPKRWASDVKLFEGINYNNLYNGIDLKIYSQDLQPKYDFIVKAGADVSKIAMRYIGANGLQLNEENLIITTSLGSITEQKPYAYQNINGKNIEVSCKYLLTNNQITFNFPNGYNKNYELIIDPILIGSTFSGSTADNWGYTATYDNSGNMYSGGIATTQLGGTFPVTTGAFQTSFGGGGVGGSYPWPWDIAIVKYNPTGSSQIYATYLGGWENDFPHSMVVNANDELYVYGKTYSTNFPVSASAFDKTSNGKADIFVTKFNSSGTTLVGSTYIGGSNDDGVNFNAYESSYGNLKFNFGDDARGEIIVDQNNDCYIASCTKSFNFPVTLGAYKTGYIGGGQDGCIFKLNNDLSSLTFSTFLGGTADDACFSLTLDSQNNVCVAGGTMSVDFPITSGVLNSTYKGQIDGFVSIIKKDGTSLVASTFIGTTSYDQCYFVQCDKKDNVYVYGQTKGMYTTTSGVYKSAFGGIFIHKLNSTLTVTGFSTIIGDSINTSPNISPSAFFVDNCENIYISGWGGKGPNTGGSQGKTTGLPVTSSAYQLTTDGSDFYLMSLSKDATILIYATFLGSISSFGEHIDGGTSRFDKSGNLYQSVCAGCGGSSIFPTTTTAWSKTNKSNNCNNAIFKIDFQTPQVDNTVTQTGTTLTANQSFATYQWVDCNNSFSALIGETNQSYTPVINGDYAVIITQGNCSTISNCFNVSLNGVNDLYQQNGLRIYPNPNDGSFTIKGCKQEVYIIVNGLGQIIKTLELNAINNFSININTLSNGIYFIYSNDANASLKQKIVVLN